MAVKYSHRTQLNITGASTWNSRYNFAKIDGAEGDCTVTLEAAVLSAGILIFKQNETGGHTLTINGTAIDVNPAGGSKTVVTYAYDGDDIVFDTNYGASSLRLETPELVATPFGDAQINLSWGLIDGATGYQIQKSLDGISWTFLVDLTDTDDSYEDTGLDDNTTYHYRLKAIGDGDKLNSLWSKTSAATEETDVTAPTVVSATAINPTTIRVVFSEIVTATNVGWSFKKNGSANNPTAVSGSGTDTLDFTVPAVSFGDTLLRSYDSATGDTQDASGNELANFTDAAVTGVSLTTLTFTARSGTITESPSGTYQGSNGAHMVADQSLASSTDGYVQCKIPGSVAEAVAMGLDVDSTLEYYSATAWKFWVFVFGGKYYYAGNGLSGSGVDTGVTYATNDLMRLRRAGSTVYFEKSSDNGANWTNLHTYVATDSGQLWIKVGWSTGSGGTKKITDPKALGV